LAFAVAPLILALMLRATDGHVPDGQVGLFSLPAELRRHIYALFVAMLPAKHNGFDTLPTMQEHSVPMDRPSTASSLSESTTGSTSLFISMQLVSRRVRSEFLVEWVEQTTFVVDFSLAFWQTAKGKTNIANTPSVLLRPRGATVLAEQLGRAVQDFLSDFQERFGLAHKIQRIRARSSVYQRTRTRPLLKELEAIDTEHIAMRLERLYDSLAHPRLQVEWEVGTVFDRARISLVKTCLVTAARRVVVLQQGPRLIQNKVQDWYVVDAGVVEVGGGRRSCYWEDWKRLDDPEGTALPEYR
jgi:hypothetical protein